MGKEAVQEARDLLKQVLQTGEDMKNESLTYECLKMILQVCIQGEDVAEARVVLERLMALKPEDDELKSDSARINRMETQLTLQKGLQAAVSTGDTAKAGETLLNLHELMKEGKVTWDSVRTCKVGKDVGNAMKMGDPDLAAQAQKVVREIQALAQRAGLGL